jgi:cell division septation protein DedD
MSPRLEIEHDERDEAQNESRRRGQGLRAALLALLVAGMVGGSWWAGHRNSQVAQDVSAVPEIHPDSAPVKEPPKDPGGMVVPGQDSVLLNRDAKGKPEELLPPPEAVKPRPAPPVQPLQSAAAPPSAPAATTVPSAPVAPAPSTAQPPTAAPSPQVVAAQPTPAVPAAPIGGPAQKVAPLPGISSSSGYRLQLGALKTEEAAKTEWLKLQRQNSDVLGKLSLSVSRVDLGAKGTYYRIQAGPIADEGKAAQDCAALKSRKIGCILVKP